MIKRVAVTLSTTTSIRPLIFALGLSLVAAASATPAMGQAKSADVTFAIRTTSGVSDSASALIERMLISGSRLRIDISTDPPDAELGGTYMILNVADSSVTLVTPLDRTAQIVTIPPRPVATPDVGRMAITDITTDSIEDLGPSEPLFGHDLHHYRVTRAATLTTTIGGRACMRKVDSIEEMWIATDEGLAAQLRAAEQRATAVFGPDGSTGESWMDAFDAAAKKHPPHGLALRSVRMSYPDAADSTSDTDAFAMEYIELSTAPINPALFAVPAGSQVQDLRGTTVPDLAAVIAGIAGRDPLRSAAGC
jgi:hypothetical protein